MPIRVQLFDTELDKYAEIFNIEATAKQRNSKRISLRPAINSHGNKSMY